jgi:TM2 domain-containing membrane protein YozV
VTDSRRTWCSACGALAAADAEWCGQCYEPLRREPAGGPPATVDLVDPAPPGRAVPRVPMSAALLPGGEPVRSVTSNGNGNGKGHGPATDARPAPEALAKRPTWPCAVCETENDLELEQCTRCGAPFSRLFEPDEPGERIDSRSAFVRSLIFPGLGQIAVGNPGDGVARIVLFLWSLGTALLLLLSHGSVSSSLKPTGLLFLLVAVGLYLVSAVDASRVASRGAPLLSPRGMLYGTIGMILLSVGSLFLMVTRAAGGG